MIRALAAFEDWPGIFQTLPAFRDDIAKITQSWVLISLSKGISFG